MVGWLTDGFRLAGAFVVWNVRKSVFRLRRASTFSPCQNPSDSGRAWETRCDASFGWRRPARFRSVCPLLRPAPDGTLKCSVDTADVRPFWGRAIVFYVAALLAIYLLAVGVGFGVLRTIGYPVRVRSIAWPSAWGEIDQARSVYFYRRAEAAYAAQQINEAVLSLRLAYDFDRQNYPAGLMLARIWQAGRPDIANHLYGQLLAEHPEQRPETAQHWLRAMLPRGDFAGIEELAAAALQFDADHAGAWVHALLFATSRTGNRDLLQRVVSARDPLPPGVAHVLSLELRLAQGPDPAVLDELARPREATQPDFVVHHQIRRLIGLGFPQAAMDLITLQARRLSDYDRISLELEALATLNHRPLRRVAFDNLVGHSTRLPVVELIASHLIRHPDPALYDRWRRQFDLDRLPADDRHVAALTLLAVAGAQGDADHVAALAEQVRTRAGASYTALTAAEAFFRDPKSGRIEAVLPVLQPLSLEVNYALLVRFGPPPAKPAQP